MPSPSYIAICICLVLAFYNSLQAQPCTDQLYTEAQGLYSNQITSAKFLKDGRLVLDNSRCQNLHIFDGVRSEVIDKPGMIFIGEDSTRLWFLNCFDVQSLFIFNPNGIWDTIEINGLVQHNSFQVSYFLIDSVFNVYNFNKKNKKYELWYALNIPDSIRTHYVIGTESFHHELYITTKNQSGQEYRLIINPELKSISGIFPYRRDIHVMHRSQYTLFKDYVLNHANEKINKYQSIIGKPCVFFNHAYVYSNFKHHDAVMVKSNDGAHHVIRFDFDGTPHLIASGISKDAFNVFSQDRYGHIWYGTPKGLRKQNKALGFHPSGYNNVPEAIHGVTEDGHGRIWVGGYQNGGFSFYDKNKKKWNRPKDPALHQERLLPGIWSDQKGVIYYFAEVHYGLHSIQNEKKKLASPIAKDNYLMGYYIRPLKNNFLGLGTTNKGLALWDWKNTNSVRYIGKEKGNLLSNVLTFTEDKRGRIWMGRQSQGLALYDPALDTAVTWLHHQTNRKLTGSMCMLIDSSNTLWFGVKGAVRYISNPEQFSWNLDIWKEAAIMELPYADTSLVTSMIESVKYLITGSEKGIYLMPKERNPEHQKIYSLRYGIEIPGGGTSQNGFYIDKKGTLWVTTAEGALEVDINQLRFDEEPVRILLPSCIAGGEIISLNQNHWDAPVGKRNITLNWTCTGNAHLSTQIAYVVHVLNHDGDTTYSQPPLQASQCQLSYLPPGAYSIFIHALKNNEIVGSAQYQLTIPRHLHESIWFWLLIGLTVLSLPVVYLIFHYKQKKSQLIYQSAIQQKSKELDHARIQTLSNFFNPHFINNALNWVQSKYRKDPDTAIMIGRLADNIKTIFAHSAQGQTVHSLDAEFHLVENYLQISRIRFGNIFTYQIPTAEEVQSLSQVYDIPVLMLQVLAENAVEKGLADRGGGGMFHCEISETARHLQIVLKDNGAGRKNLDWNRLENRKSSTRVLEEMIQLLNHYNKEQITFTYYDFFLPPDDRYMEPHGTLITITIPKTFSYVIQ